MKTTKSGWSNFVQDKFTTLAETDERILATTISAEWAYCQASRSELDKLEFGKIHERVKDELLKSFFGPAHCGIFSPGVQRTLHRMGSNVLQAVPQISSVKLSLPNLHFLPCELPVMRKNGLRFQHDIYIPTSEPHGIISAVVSRRPSSKL